METQIAEVQIKNSQLLQQFLIPKTIIKNALGNQ